MRDVRGELISTARSIGPGRSHVCEPLHSGRPFRVAALFHDLGNDPNPQSEEGQKAGSGYTLNTMQLLYAPTEPFLKFEYGVLAAHMISSPSSAAM
jgi:hypothetical protein